LIPGISDAVRPVTSEEKKIYEPIDFNVSQYQQETGSKGLLYNTKQDILMHRWRFPSLSLHGIEGAFSGVGAKVVYFLLLIYLFLIPLFCRFFVFVLFMHTRRFPSLFLHGIEVLFWVGAKVIYFVFFFGFFFFCLVFLFCFALFLCLCIDGDFLLFMVLTVLSLVLVQNKIIVLFCFVLFFIIISNLRIYLRLLFLEK
jgi:hypothetical protein